MKCPKCDAGSTRVINTTQEPDRIRRRRKCKMCQHRWNTLEMPADLVEEMEDLHTSIVGEKYKEVRASVLLALPKLRHVEEAMYYFVKVPKPKLD